MFAAFVMLLSASAFASTTAPDVLVSKTIQSALASDFTGASNVKWEINSGFYFANFKLKDQVVEAAYSGSGELIGTARRVSHEAMPLLARTSLEKNYAGYELEKGALELTYNGQTSYYVLARNAKVVVKLKIESNGDIEVTDKKRTA